jgi:hypothetical protein
MTFFILNYFIFYAYLKFDQKEIVELLLTHNAEINIKNNEGFKPKDLVTDPAIKKLIQGRRIIGEN